MLAHAYFKEIVNSKLLLRRQIESKVACVVYLASKKYGFLCTRDEILAKIPARSKEFDNCISICESDVVIYDTLNRIKSKSSCLL